MSPSSSSSSSRELNGPRPAPLKINKASHQIQKPCPIIIYTQSPKVIHTKARDFMALVQKLTGLSPSHSRNRDDENDARKPEKKQILQNHTNECDVHASEAVPASSSMSFSCSELDVTDFAIDLGFDPMLQMSNPNNFFSEISMLTPNLFIFNSETTAFPEF